LLIKQKKQKEILMARCFNGITDAQWSKIKPFLPAKKNKTGRPFADLRKVINSVLHVLFEGSRWKSIPKGENWAPKSTAYGWMKKLQQDGVLKKIKSELIKEADKKELIKWKNVLFDGTFSPGKGGGEQVEYGYKGKGSTIHAITDENGMFLNARISPANGNERLEVVKLLSASYICKNGSIENAHADKGYDSEAVRSDLRNIGIRPMIPYRNFKNRLPKKATSQPKIRWKIERTFAWLKTKFRRIATRWERKVDIWKGFLDLAIAMMWIDKLVFG